MVLPLTVDPLATVVASRTGAAVTMESLAAQVRPPSDRDLVDRVRDGDPRAFGELACLHQQNLYRLALHILRDGAEAEDVTQEAFVRMHAALDRLDARSEPSASLYRILVNLSLHRVRARRGAPRFRPPPNDDPRLDGVADQAPSISVPSGGAAGRGGLYAALARALDGLSETLRVTLILVLIDGRSHAEAGEILGASETTIASRVHGAKRELHEALAAYGYDSTAVAILEPEDVLSDEPNGEPSFESLPCLPMGMETDLTVVLEQWPRVATERRDWAHFAARVEARLALTKRAKSLESVSDEQLLASPLPEVGFKDFAKPAGRARPPSLTPTSRAGVRAMTEDDSRGDGSESPEAWAPAPPMVPVSVALLSESPAVPGDGSAPALDRRASIGGVASLVGLAIAAATFFVMRTERAPEAARSGATALAATGAVAQVREATPTGGATSATPAELPGVDPMTLPRAAVLSEASHATEESHEVRRARSLDANVHKTDAEEAVAPASAGAAPTEAESPAPTATSSALLDSGATAESAPSTSLAPTPMALDGAAPQVPAAAPTASARLENATDQRPSQGEVMGALAGVLPAARDCLSEGDDVSRARVIFGSDGAVHSVTVSGFAVGKPSESCIGAALGKARVPAFKDPTYGATVTVRP